MRTAIAAACIMLTGLGCAASPPTAAPAAQQSEMPLRVRSTPADGATVAGPVDNLELKFTRPVRLIEVTLDGPDGLSPMMVTAASETSDYSLPLPGLTAGRYRVNWRGTAGGRSHQGAFVFTVRD